MPARSKTHNWSDVQTAITTAAIVTTIGLWNLFATPTKTITTQVQEPTDTSAPPPTDPPMASQEGIPMPHVKVMFTQVAPQTVTVTTAQQPQQSQVRQKKKKNNNTNGGSQSVTQTKSS